MFQAISNISSTSASTDMDFVSQQLFPLTSPSKNDFRTFSTEIWQHIVMFCDFKECIFLEGTCSYFCKLFNHYMLDQNAWAKKVQHALQIPSLAKLQITNAEQVRSVVHQHLFNFSHISISFALRDYEQHKMHNAKYCVSVTMLGTQKNYYIFLTT